MNTTYISLIINILLIFAFIIDRVVRLYSIKEYKEAKEEIIKSKEAQITALKQHIEFSEKLNDDFITEIFKKRTEDLKQIILDKDNEIKINLQRIEEIKQSKQTESKEIVNLFEDIKNIQTETKFYSRFILALHQIRKPAANLQGLLALKKDNLISDTELASYISSVSEELSLAVVNAINTENY
jgi:hypothetical protein